MLKKEFEKEFSSGEYIRNLNEFIDKYGDFDNEIRKNRLTEREIKTIDMLPYLYEKLDNYFDLRGIYIEDDIFYMSYKEFIYRIMCENANYSCTRYKDYEYGLNMYVTLANYNDLNNSISRGNLHLTMLSDIDDNNKSCLNCTNEFCDHSIDDDDQDYCILWQNDKVKKLKKEGIR